MSTKFKYGSTVTDDTVSFMKPAIGDNAKIKTAYTHYGFRFYVENDPYNGNSYWSYCSNDPDFDSDDEAIECLCRCKNEQIRPTHPDTYKVCELTIYKTLETEETIVVDSPESVQELLNKLIDRKQDASLDNKETFK